MCPLDYIISSVKNIICHVGVVSIKGPAVAQGVDRVAFYCRRVCGARPRLYSSPATVPDTIDSIVKDTAVVGTNPLAAAIVANHSYCVRIH